VRTDRAIEGGAPLTGWIRGTVGPVNQEVRFCTSADGTRLAYAIHGSGPPLVRVATWLTHLDFDWESPVWRHWLATLGERHTVIRYDERGCGLSDPDPGDPSLETWVADLEAVVDAVGLDRFALLGVSQGAAIAVSYAARHPERVSDLVLYGGFARGRRLRGQRVQDDAVVASIRAGWMREDPTYRQVFSALFLPNGTAEQKAWYEDLLRASTSAETAVQLFEARGWLDASDLAPEVTARTLVVHARDDRAVPVEEGRLLAAMIPDARLVLLESANHILLADEPAWGYFVSELHAFLGTGPVPGPPAAATEFSSRELEVLELVAAGLANESIAERLSISVRTVERHLSNVYAKLGVSGKAGRAAAAVAFMQLSPPPSAAR
jgi:pimeloyl-ACP methyl ester carboxylesterase/DNA-binding CsgD family transcriptional regulator